MPIPYKPLAIANEFIAKSAGDGVSHMKLQKLTYFSYGWWLAYNDDTIINEEPQVWQHGPVFKSLYHALSRHGWRDITTVQNDNFTTAAPRVDEGCQVQNLVTWVWDRYGEFDGDYLSDITHKKGTPWETTAADFGYRVPKNTPISSARIQAHFKELAVEYGFSEAG
jgi:uncharacterized phage-associated protein